MPAVPSAYARYIGRVGALAVALGIGAMVVTGNGLGVAHAQDGPSNNDGQTTDAPATTDATVDPSSESGNTDPTENQGPPESGQTLDNPMVPEMKLGNSGGLIESGNLTDNKEGVDVDEKKDPPTDPPAAPVEPPKPEILPAANNVPPGGGTGLADRKLEATKESFEPTTLTESKLDKAGVDTVQVTSPPPSFSRFATFAEDEPGTFALTGQQLSLASTEDTVGVAAVEAPQPGLFALPGAIINFAVSVVNTIFTSFLGGGSTPAGQTPLLFALLAFVRNEFQRGLPPTAVADTITTSENTQKTFTEADLVGDDAGQNLKVVDFTQPANGTLVKNENGTFTYTPKNNWSGTDSFTYTASDEDGPFHLHFYQLDGDAGHTSTATVTITVTNTEQGDLLSNTVIDSTEGPDYELRAWERGGASGQADSTGKTYTIVGDEVHIYNPDNTLYKTAKLPTYQLEPGKKQEWVDIAPIGSNAGEVGGAVYAVDYRFTPMFDGGKPESAYIKKLVLDANGNYVVDPTFSPDSYTTGSGATLKTHIPQGQRIATDQYGNLYVAQGMFLPAGETVSTVIKILPDGTIDERFGAFPDNAGQQLDLGRLDTVIGLAVSQDGKVVYTTEAGEKNDRVQRWEQQIDGSYQAVKAWGPAGDGPDGQGKDDDLGAPQEVGVDAAGYIYVLDSSDSEIIKYKYDDTTDTVIEIARMYVGGNDPVTPPAGETIRAHGLVVTARGDAISSETGRIMYAQPYLL
jgi:hypothetical protein